MTHKPISVWSYSYSCRIIEQSLLTYIRVSFRGENSLPLESGNLLAKELGNVGKMACKVESSNEMCACTKV